MKTVTFQIPEDLSVGYFMHYIAKACNYYHELESDKAYDEHGEEYSNYVSETIDRVVNLVNLKCFDVPEWHEYETVMQMTKETK